MGVAKKKEPEGVTPEDRIAALEAENAKLRDVLLRTAAFNSRKGGELATAGAELNKLLGL